MTTDPLAALVAQLATLAMTNTASHVVARVKAAKTGKQAEQQINALTELINELVDERNQLVGIARGFEQELVAQRISPSDITYITDTVIPTIEELLPNDESEAENATSLQQLKSILSVEMLTVLQLVGFNYRQAIGEPLTTLVKNLILAQVTPADLKAEVDLIAARSNLAVLEIMQDPAAADRLDRFNS